MEGAGGVLTNKVAKIQTITETIRGKCMSTDEICFMSATDLAEKVRSRRLSAVEVVQAFLARIDRVNPSLNAYITVCAEQALAEARKADERLFQATKPAPLHGVPFSVKDLVYTAGVRTTSGSRIHEKHVPAVDAISVSRLRAAGAILLGKTNTPEFGYKATTENPLFGPTCNPWDLGKTPGGSSGGAAAATASGLSPLSVGTDGGGSIRIPASFCGVFGLKATYGLVPTLPGSGGWRTLSHTGPITRAVRDAALMLDVMAGPHELDRTSIPGDGTSYLAQLKPARLNLRLGYSSNLGFAFLDDEVKAVVESALPTFERLGHTVEEVKIDLGPARDAFMAIVLAENAAACGGYLEKQRALMDEGLVMFIEAGFGVTTLDYLAASRSRDTVAAELVSFFRGTTC